MRFRSSWRFLILALSITGTAFAENGPSGSRRVVPEVAPDFSHLTRSMIPQTSESSPSLAAPLGVSAALQALPPAAPDVASGAVHFSGTVAYQVSGNYVVMAADYVYNDSATYTTGTLRMDLWFSAYGYRQTGYDTAQYTLGTLAPNHYFYNINSGSVAFSWPPTGCYYVSMLLMEYQGGGTWLYVDYVDFTSLASVNGGCSSTCAYGISPSSASTGASSANGSVTVTGSPSGCTGSWSAYSNSSWITITSGSSGSGAGPSTVYYTVAANSSSSSRTGSMTIAGSTFTVTQSGTSGGCVDDLSNGVICLRSSRFKVVATWQGFEDNTWRPVIWKRQSDETALGVFQNNQNDVTMIAKMAWGCPFNNYYWFWLGGFTDGGWNIVVTDLQTNYSKSYTRTRNAGSFPTTIRDETTYTCP